MVQTTPRPVADGLVVRYAETDVVVARARRLSPSVYVASAVLSAELSCCPRKLRTSISSKGADNVHQQKHRLRPRDLGRRFVF
jgi:hypothetical protein